MRENTISSIEIKPLVSQSQQIRAEVEAVTFHSDETGWAVLKVRNCNSNDSFTATGHLPAIHPGEFFELFGTWAYHPTYGRQFKIDRAVSIRPTTRAAIIRYLSSEQFKGIGFKTAEKIVNTFKLEALDILDYDPERLYEVDGLGKKKIEQILSSWQSSKANSSMHMFLSQYEFSPAIASKIIKRYDKNTISIISANPYRLIDEIRGVGFLSADKIARSLGINPASEERMLAAITYLLAQAEEEGHCFLFEEQLKSRLEELIKVVIQDYSAKFDNCVALLQTTNAIVKENIIDQNLNLTKPAYYLGNLFLAEIEVVYKIKDMINGHANIARQNNEILEHRIQSWINKFTKKKGIQLTEKQILAVIQAAQSKIFILTGGPGVGKTTTADTIIRLLKAMSKSVSLAAPTGRAAQRLSEVSSLPAKTVHRLLEWNGSDGNFEKNSINQIESDVIIIDEASMLDINLTHKLFSALRNSSQLILIGDTDQLPSIGPGNVLRDLIASQKIACCELDEVFRQSAKSRIIQSAHAINKGQLPDFSNETGSDCRFITAESNASIKATIEDLILNKLPAAGYDQFNDVQILTPMNRGELGTINLNEQLQNILNPIHDNEHEYKVNKQRFLIGDKVIQCVNNYELGVFNGDIGFIEHVRANGAKLIVKFNERLVNYNSEQASELKLAYAITIHKSQGSEFPAVIIPITMQHYIMLQRNLIYTALTRAKKLAIFIGSKKALQYAAQNQTSHTRQTRLKEKLEIQYPKYPAQETY